MTDPSAPAVPVTAESPTREAILVGVDDESPSRHALEWALRRAERAGAAVCAAWVVGTGQNDDDARRTLAQRVEAARGAAGIGPEVVPVAEELLHGDVVGELLGRAARVDLLVIGTNFTPSLVGRLRGTRSLKLAADAPVPVIVVPEVELDGRSGVVVGVDGSETDHPAVPWAANEAARSGDELVLLHAAVVPVGAVPAYVDPSELQHAVVDDAHATVDAVAARVREEHPELAIHCRVTSDLPAHALSEAGATASLVVVGSRGLGTLRRFLQGSVSAEVMLTMAGPVAIVR